MSVTTWKAWTWTCDEATRTVSLEGKALPEILSLEHDVDYYDLEEGLFNSFTAAEINRINAQAQE